MKLGILLRINIIMRNLSLEPKFCWNKKFLNYFRDLMSQIMNLHGRYRSFFHGTLMPIATEHGVQMQSRMLIFMNDPTTGHLL